MKIFESLVTLVLVNLVEGTLYNRFEDVPSHSTFDFVIIGGNFLCSTRTRPRITCILQAVLLVMPWQTG